MDAAAADWRRRQAFFGVVAMRGIDIVDHQVERRFRSGLERPLGLSDDDVGPAAQFEHREPVHRHDRAQTDGFEPARSGADIGDIEVHMADRDRRPLIDGIGHGDFLHVRLKATAT